MSEASLTAFYDLRICPVTYDFTVFMALAEMARRRLGCEGLHVVIIPGDDDGFRNDDVSYSTANKEWRLRNIVVPSCWLFNRATSVTICNSREEATAIEAALTGPVFPLSYSTKQPVGDFLWSSISAALACGEQLPQAQPSAEASRIVRDWLAAHAGKRRPIAITLRESGHAPVRNSNVAAWREFARTLDPKIYVPVFIPDTERAFDSASPPDGADGSLVWPAAALNLDLRLALYEQSWLNLMVTNGPGILCWLNSKSRFIMFKMLNPAWVNTSQAYLASLGIAAGRQPPFATPFQRLVWEPDTLQVIEREFADMAERIGDVSSGTAMAADSAKAEDPIAVAVRLHATGRLEEATAVYHDIVTKNPKNADAWNMLGIIAHQADRPDVAEKMVRLAMSIKPRQANIHITLAAVLRKLGREDEAAACLRQAIVLAPKDAGAHADLAEVLQVQGAGEEAAAAMLKAMRLKPDSQELCERAARVLHALGHGQQAANLYSRAIELREARIKATQQARSQMPEIPVASLKTV
jgi:Flp pilus assembly protein TadD